nr:MAG TPA: hypothetical protein [Caudoviricetes sp.]
MALLRLLPISQCLAACLALCPACLVRWVVLLESLSLRLPDWPRCLHHYKKRSAILWAHLVSMVTLWGQSSELQ